MIPAKRSAAICRRARNARRGHDFSCGADPASRAGWGNRYGLRERAAKTGTRGNRFECHRPPDRKSGSQWQMVADVLFRRPDFINTYVDERQLAYLPSWRKMAPPPLGPANHRAHREDGGRCVYRADCGISYRRFAAAAARFQSDWSVGARERI